jgi:hypothetical protein
VETIDPMLRQGGETAFTTLASVRVRLDATYSVYVNLEREYGSFRYPVGHVDPSSP